MGKYKAYEKYKDSGVEWLGEIPEHWELVRFSHYIDFQEGPGIMAADFKDYGVPLLRIHNLKPGFVELEGCNYLDPEKVEKTWKHFKLNKDDLLISCSASTGLVSIVDDKAEGAIAYTGIIRLNPATSNICREFIKIVVSSELFFTQIELLKTGTTIQHYGPVHLRQIKITLPPLPEQQAIANFLDYKTQQIDALINKKETLLEKLDEKCTAIISHAVTKGLDPNVPMKDSGIEWLGEIPEHWEIIQIKRAFILQRGVDITQENQTEGVIPVVSSGGIASYHNVAYAKPPGVLVGRKGTIGNVHYVEVDYWPHDTTLWVIEFYKNNPRFIYYKLLSMNLQDWDTGSANPTLNRNLIHPLKTSWPSIKEQEKIVDYLDKNTAKINQQKAKIKQAIDLLKEYRTALITNAVTGKIDVRQVSIP